MGRTAMRMLLDLLNGAQVANVRVTGKLIVRESTTKL
jgi:DNA-binding LacI/PurR family transcriptional regulator